MPEEDNNIKNNRVADEPSTTKYLIHASFSIDGLVEKPDVVGALFGQTEGLLSEDLDLRELQKSGRVGRINVNLNFKGGKTRGSLEIPSSLDKVETSILAAAIETVDRIGPCAASISIKKIEDIRIEKMKKIRERASELLQKWNSETTQESSELADEVSKKARISGISHFGPLPAGPELSDSDTIIIVEGRADIAACLRAGIRNTVAVQGASIPKSVVDLTKKKTTIAFLDGDRGGDLILKELLMYSDIDYIARAPIGREVEDLKPDEIIEQIRKKVPLEKATFTTEIHANEILDRAIKRKHAKMDIKGKPKQIQEIKVESRIESPRPKLSTQSTSRPSRPTQQQTEQKSRDKKTYTKGSTRKSPSYSRSGRERIQRTTIPKEPIPEELIEFVKLIDGKEVQEGIFLDANTKEIKRVSVSTIYDEIKKMKGISKIIFDGIITQRMLDLCSENNIDVIVGARTGKIENKPQNIKYYTFA